MTNTPKDGDFAAMLEGRGRPATAAPASASAWPASANEFAGREGAGEADVPEEEAEEGFPEAPELPDGAPPLSDEELERQALEAGGGDNDPDTPE